ncbi:LLM class flavin-dependent oxidoreductase [Streptomyces eurythermus]
MYGLGFELPPLRDRFGRLAETLRLAHQMWAGDRTPFHGEYVRVPEPINEPNVARRPPILVGGGGERRTLALVARYADACNFFEPLGGDTIRHKFAVLREHCERVGRPFEEIDRTTYGELLLRTPEHPEGDSVDQVVDRFGALAELGVDEAVVGLNNPLDASVHELLGEVVRQTRPLVPKGR